MSLQAALIRLAIAQGADHAVVIPQQQVVLSEQFYAICQSNACGQFGRNYMCPPDVGDIEDLMARVREYPQVLVYQTISQLEDSFDWEGMQAAAQRHAQLSQRIRAAVHPLLPVGSLHLTCGGCGLCEPCAKVEGQPCRFPEDALPSVESYGVDVANTVKGTQLKYINGANTVTYFGMVCYQEA